MSVLLAALAVVAFGVLLRLSRATDHTRLMLATARESTAVLADRARTDDEKEAAARAASAQFAVHALQISGRLLFALAVPGLVLALAVLARLANAAELERTMISWPILALGVVMTVVGFWRRR